MTLLAVRSTRNSVLMPRKITGGKLSGMVETTDWHRLHEPWERLKWARIRWQRRIGSAETARAAAESLGMNENTYSAYERPPGAADKTTKHTPLDGQRAIQFGGKFKVNWVWLLTGNESPFARTPAQERAVALLSEVSEDAQEEAVAVIEALIRRRAAR
jgi:hypothetical protein